MKVPKANFLTDGAGGVADAKVTLNFYESVVEHHPHAVIQKLEIQLWLAAKKMKLQTDINLKLCFEQKIFFSVHKFQNIK